MTAICARPGGPRAALQTLLLVLTLAGFGQAAQAELPQPITHYLSDFADALPGGEEIELADQLALWRQTTGIDVAVATIGSPADYGAAPDLAAFSKALFNQWGIGDPVAQDGILLVLALQSREVRIALGTGYPPVWDGRAHRVIEAIMLPKLAQGDAVGALRDGLQGIEDYIVQPFAEGRPVRGTEDMPGERRGGIDLDLAIFLAAALAALSFIFWGNRHDIGDWLAKRRPCPSCGHRGVVVERQDTTGPEGPMRQIRRRCPGCGWHEDRRSPQPGRQRRDDREPHDGSGRESAAERDSGGHRGEGGGGEGGGGQSSGGGASGRW